MGASPGEALCHGVEGVASIEVPGEAGEVALGVFWADMVIGAGQCCLDVADHRQWMKITSNQVLNLLKMVNKFELAGKIYVRE